MNKSIINLTSLGLALLALLALSSCKKDDIAPARQDTVFAKYYGHVGSQHASDVIQTGDGFIMIGSTNSYSNLSYRDIFVTKVDTAGNETWSQIYGLNQTSSNTGTTYIDEEGMRILELPAEEGYLLMANRTYFSDPDQDGTFTPDISKIVLYKIDLTGAVVTEGTELKASDIHSYWGYDIKMNRENGFVITGETSNVNVNKPQYDPATDQRDIFITRLNPDLTETWSSGLGTGSQGRGFVGVDRGVSLEIVSDGGGATEFYVVVGRVQLLDSDGNFDNNIIVAKYEPSQGGIVNQQSNYGTGLRMEAVSSCYDSINNQVTVLADFTDPSQTVSQNELAVFNIDVASLNVSLLGNIEEYPSTYNLNNQFGNSISSDLFGNDIALLPNDEGFLILATLATSDLESQIMLFKVAPNLVPTENSERFFGWRANDPLFSTRDEGAQVITVSDAIAGTNQTAVNYYALTGTFDSGTNQMMGLVKVRNDGSFDPDGDADE